MKQFNVAIVGAGPAGLAAAKDLLTAGYSVDIFDKENFAGGVMAFGIPSFRFKMDAIEKQVAPVRDLGGVFHFGCDLKVFVKPTPSVGVPQDTYNFKDKEVNSLLIEGRHDAAIILRAMVVCEAACAIALCDAMLINNAYKK